MGKLWVPGRNLLFRPRDAAVAAAIELAERAWLPDSLVRAGGGSQHVGGAAPGVRRERGDDSRMRGRQRRACARRSRPPSLRASAAQRR